MSIFNLIQFICGISFFLFGMTVLSENLEKSAGGSLERVLKRAQKKPALSLALGALITMVIQSSSATSVMLVGLTNSGIMSFAGTLYIIFGANIGTTVTAWILSLAGIESQNLFVSLLKPENFTPFLALLGVILMMSAKSGRKRDAGRVLVGFSVLIYGMKLMTGAVSPLADTPWFTSVMVSFKNPFVCLLAGLVITAIIQSSSASVGILQAFAVTGGISYAVAIPIIMGQNIGTCVTALISSVGAGKNAKRVAFAHTAVNVIGAAVCLGAFEIIRLWKFPFLDDSVSTVGIALMHSAFNIIITVILLPFVKPIEKLICKIIPDRDAPQDEIAPLDERLYNSPSVAVSECMSRTRDMAELAARTVKLSISQISEYDEQIAQTIEQNEKKSDRYEDVLLSGLVKIARKSLSDADSARVSRMLYTVSDLERLCDHALHISKNTGELLKISHGYSKGAMDELSVLDGAVNEIIDNTTRAFLENDSRLATLTEPLEQVIDKLTAKIMDRHVERLKNGECSTEQGLAFADLLTDLERISDHCSNIAAAVIELEHGTFETHRYLNRVKYSSGQFDSNFAIFDKKYHV